MNIGLTLYFCLYIGTQLVTGNKSTNRITHISPLLSNLHESIVYDARLFVNISKKKAGRVSSGGLKVLSLFHAPSNLYLEEKMIKKRPVDREDDEDVPVKKLSTTQFVTEVDKGGFTMYSTGYISLWEMGLV